jgi:putative ABC transport system permease protein
VALLLASLGIYGVMAFHAGLRRYEMGIRMALGAQVGQVQRIVLGEGMRLVVLGLVVGLAGGAALSRLLRSSLFEIAPSDPSSYVVAAIALAAVALAACWIPARRASRVDPAEALRVS